MSYKGKKNPFLLDRPASVSFSGGRTSGKMLYEIKEAFGGELPPDVHVTFANTGKEREETLDFIHECEERWGVEIVWLEYCTDQLKPVVQWKGKQAVIGNHSFRRVTYDTASRKGEPFEMLVDTKAKYRKEVKDSPPVLPNPVQRFCTGELKQRTMERYLKSVGCEEYTVAVGLRADEPKRVAKLHALDNQNCTHVAPLAAAGMTVADVTAFWAEQPFDLKLKNHPEWGTYEGNCDLCFLKSQAKMRVLLEERPQDFDWWAAMEEKTGARFRKDRGGYRDMQQKRFTLKQCDDSQDTCFCTD